MFRTIFYSDMHTHQLFTGHRGCGKSTELLRLKNRLEGDGFYVVYFTADEDLDLNDLMFTDLLLSIARRIVAQASEDGINIGDALNALETWFAEVIYQKDEWEKIEAELRSEAGVSFGLPKGLPFIAKLLTRLTGQIKTGSEIKKEIRWRLDSRIPQLIRGLNDLLGRVEVEMLKASKKGVVVLVDNLDRITYRDLGDGRTSHDALYIEHGNQFCALNCHTIYTVPLSMMYGLSAGTLDDIFDCSYVLPMIKSHEPRARGGGLSATGMQRLRDIIARRIDINALCEPEAVEYLCQACGGHPRDLMTLIRHSIEYADENQPKPITLAAAKHAEAKLISTFSRMIPENFFEKLVAVYRTNIIKKDTDHRNMLSCQSVLEYADEPDEADPEKQTWHDVHPAVQKLKGFREVLNKYSKLATES